MQEEQHRISCLSLGWPMDIASYGHWGQPLIVLPTSRGRMSEFEGFGMIRALSDLIDGGHLKVYCPDGADHDNWYNSGSHPAHRAYRYTKYVDFIVHDVVAFVRRHCWNDGIRPWLTGASWGAFHAANLALRFPELFPRAICMSGAYDLGDMAGNYSDENVYFNNPMAYLWRLEAGPYRDRLIRAANLTLICGQGPWEDRALQDTWNLHNALSAKGIPHEFDLWGHDTEHDWPAWRKQIRYHMGRKLGA